MELLNSSTVTVSNNLHISSKFPVFSNKFFITKRKQKTPSRLVIPGNSIKLLPRPSSYLVNSPLSAPSTFRISAHFGRPTNRRNSLREKITQREEEKRLSQVSDNDISVNGGVEKSSLDVNYDVSNKEPESESKLLGESVMWHKLEGWVEQYKKDTEFWGIGTGPIFTVFEDPEGKVKRVDVNKNEILKRNGVEPALYKDSEIAELSEVNLKISRARELAKEMESGNYVMQRNSSITKFVGSGKESGFFNSIRGIRLKPGMYNKLSIVGVLLLGGLIVVAIMKQILKVGEDRQEYTRLEKEMLRRKMIARREREKMLKGSVEVLQDSVESEIGFPERPRLDRQELMSSIAKAKMSDDKWQLPETSSQHGAKSVDFENKISEIRAMARQAREIEKRESAMNKSDEENAQVLADLSEEQDVVQLPYNGNLTSADSLLNGYAGACRNGSSCINQEADAGFDTNAAPTEINETNVHNTPNREDPEDDDDASLEQTVEKSNDCLNSMEEIRVDQTSDSLSDQSSKSSNNSMRPKFKVIRSVKEAREYLSKKQNKQEADSKGRVEIVKQAVNLANMPIEKKRTGHTSQTSDETNKMFDLSMAEERSNRFSSEDENIKVSGICPKGQEGSRGNGVVTIRSTGVSYGHENSSFKDETAGSYIRASTVAAEKDSMEEKGQNSDDRRSLPTISVDTSDAASTSNYRGESRMEKEPYVPDNGSILEDVEEGKQSVNHKEAGTMACESDSRSADPAPLVNKESWTEKNFHEFEPIVKRIRVGFKDNYMVAKAKTNEEPRSVAELIDLKSFGDEGEIEWMKDERLRDIVFRVRENELSGRDPFHLIDEEDKLAFFSGLEKKVEKENEKLLGLHEWLHSNIENLDYGADGISLYDSPEKIIPRWKGPSVDKSPEFLNDFLEQRERLVHKKNEKSSMKNKDSQDLLQVKASSNESVNPTLASNHQDLAHLNKNSGTPKTIIEGSDGSVRAGKKSGKEFWQHTKKWSQGFLESYNAETDPETKAVMRDIGKDLDRWITEKEIKEAADLMDKLPERGKKLIKEKLDKVKREMELFGPHAVVSKYREYADEKEEDYLWWLDLPYVLCIELYTEQEGEQKIGLYSLEMAADLELDPKPFHVVAFEDSGDCKSLCYIIQAHMEMLGNGNAFVVARPPKDAFREAKANGFSVTVIRKGELQLNVDLTLEEVEELITEIGSKIYHDMIMRERSVDINGLMKGVFGVRKPTKRRRTKRKLKKPTRPS